MALSLPPWLTPSDPAPAAARGFQLGLHAGAQQASQRFQQMQMARMEQQDAMQQARWDAEMGIKAAEMARKHQAQMSYRQAIEGGMDPLDAMIRFGPEMGQQASAEAAAIRAMYAKEKPIPTWEEKTTPSGVPYMLSSTGQLHVLPQRTDFTPGDVKGFNVLDPETGEPMPEFVGVPSPGGKGMTTLQRHPDELKYAQRESLIARHQDKLMQLKRDNPGIDLSENAPPPKLANQMLQREAEEAQKMANWYRSKIRQLESGRITTQAMDFGEGQAKPRLVYDWSTRRLEPTGGGAMTTSPLPITGPPISGAPTITGPPIPAAPRFQGPAFAPPTAGPTLSQKQIDEFDLQAPQFESVPEGVVSDYDSMDDIVSQLFPTLE